MTTPETPSTPETPPAPKATSAPEAASASEALPKIHPWKTISTPGRAWWQVLGTVAGMFLGAVFLVAAWAKALDPAAFASQIELEGLDFLLPSSAVAFIALALEVFLGTALFFWVRRNYILWPTAALVIFFLFLTGRTYYQDVNGTLPENTAGCGCFGNLVERTPAEAFWQDLMLMVPALLLAFVARQIDPVWPNSQQSPRVRMGAVGVLTVAVLLLAWKAPDLPLDNLATRLKPGVNIADLCAGKEEDGTRICMDGVVMGLAEGEHLVVMADLADPAFGESVSALNEFHWAANSPDLVVMTSATEEESFTFRFSYGPAFESHEAPATLLSPLYRKLPRSFVVRDGQVIETFAGMPPLERWVTPAP